MGTTKASKYPVEHLVSYVARAARLTAALHPVAKLFRHGLLVRFQAFRPSNLFLVLPEILRLLVKLGDKDVL